MKCEYVYVFGYEPPNERRMNDATSWDSESSGYFRIEATSVEEALRWGNELANAYVAHLYGDVEKGRWSRGQYASWLEDDTSDLTHQAAVLTPLLSVGDYPELEKVRRVFGE